MRLCIRTCHSLFSYQPEGAARSLPPHAYPPPLTSPAPSCLLPPSLRYQMKLRTVLHCSGPYHHLNRCPKRWTNTVGHHIHMCMAHHIAIAFQHRESITQDSSRSFIVFPFLIDATVCSLSHLIARPALQLSICYFTSPAPQPLQPFLSLISFTPQPWFT